MEQRIKEGFDAIPIPDRLSSRVEEALAHKKKSNQMLKFQKPVSIVVSVFLFLFCSVNLSKKIAKNCDRIPILGPICRLLTIH